MDEFNHLKLRYKSQQRMFLLPQVGGTPLVDLRIVFVIWPGWGCLVDCFLGWEFNIKIRWKVGLVKVKKAWNMGTKQTTHGCINRTSWFGGELKKNRGRPSAKRRFHCITKKGRIRQQGCKLVGGFNHFLFYIIYGRILPNWLIFFRGVETTNQLYKRHI